MFLHDTLVILRRIDVHIEFITRSQEVDKIREAKNVLEIHQHFNKNIVCGQSLNLRDEHVRNLKLQ